VIRSRLIVVAAVHVALLVALEGHAESSADELIRQARAHEAAHEEDVAARRYMEALTIAPMNADAWIGLAELRMKLGDPLEAERVYTSALDRVPSLSVALDGRARARWALGRHAEAEGDMESYATVDRSTAALKVLAAWYAADGRTPAQLTTWRRLLALATEIDDAPLAHDARTMVRALVIVVDGADPASSPTQPDATRRALSAIAKRGG
jgi:tetratricopeptide (TPR) repeat protein